MLKVGLIPATKDHSCHRLDRSLCQQGFGWPDNYIEQAERIDASAAF